MKLMKCTALTVLLIVCLTGGILAQNQGFNYYTYVNDQDHYYDSLRSVTPDTIKISGWRSYQRWKDFWMNRVHNDAQAISQAQGKNDEFLNH